MMEMIKLSCDLCNQGYEIIGHITMPLYKQELLLYGGHIHICSDCFEKRYRTIKKEIQSIENGIFVDVLSRRERAKTENPDD